MLCGSDDGMVKREMCLTCLLLSRLQRNWGYHQPQNTEQSLQFAIMPDQHKHHRESARTRDSRSQSPHRHHESSHRTRSPHRHHHRRKRSPQDAPKVLPFNSRQLTKRDFEAFKPMFALYLDIQKGKILEEMVEARLNGSPTLVCWYVVGLAALTVVSLALAPATRYGDDEDTVS